MGCAVHEGAPLGHDGRLVRCGVGAGVGEAVGVGATVGIGEGDGVGVGTTVGVGDGVGDGLAAGDGVAEGDEVGVDTGDEVGVGAPRMVGPISKPIDGRGEKSAALIVGRGVAFPLAFGVGPDVAGRTTTFSLERSIVEIESSPDALSLPSDVRSTWSAVPCFSPAAIVPRRLRLKLRLAPATPDAVRAYAPPLPIGKTTRE